MKQLLPHSLSAFFQVKVSPTCSAVHLSKRYYYRSRCTFRSACQVHRSILGTGTSHSWTTCT